MSEPETLALCAALEAAACGRESCIVINERAEGVQSSSAKRMLAEAGIDLRSVCAWLRAPEATGPRSLVARCVVRDFPRPGWSTHLLRRTVEGEDALHDHHAARAFRREQVRLGQDRHDLRGIANNVLLSIEIASRRIAASPQSEPVLAALQQVKKHAAKFVEGIGRLGAADAAHAQEDPAVIDLGDLLSRAARGCLARGVPEAVEVAIPEAPVYVCSRAQQLRSGLIDALESLLSTRGVTSVRADLRMDGGTAVVLLSGGTDPEWCGAESNLDTVVLADLLARDGGAMLVSGEGEGRVSIQITLPTSLPPEIGGRAASSLA